MQLYDYYLIMNSKLEHSDAKETPHTSFHYNTTLHARRYNSLREGDAVLGLELTVPVMCLLASFCLPSNDHATLL